MGSRRVSRRIYALARARGATQANAYIKAGATPGITLESASTGGYHLEKDPKVAAIIARERERVEREIEAHLTSASLKSAAYLSGVFDRPTTEFDKSKAVDLTFRATGRFVQRVEVENRRVSFRDLRAGQGEQVIDATVVPPRALPPSAPQLPKGGDGPA